MYPVRLVPAGPGTRGRDAAKPVRVLPPWSRVVAPAASQDRWGVISLGKMSQCMPALIEDKCRFLPVSVLDVTNNVRLTTYATYAGRGRCVQDPTGQSKDHTSFPLGYTAPCWLRGVQPTSGSSCNPTPLDRVVRRQPCRTLPAVFLRGWSTTTISPPPGRMRSLAGLGPSQSRGVVRVLSWVRRFHG